jgi:hypothetical protein
MLHGSRPAGVNKNKPVSEKAREVKAWSEWSRAARLVPMPAIGGHRLLN